MAAQIQCQADAGNAAADDADAQGRFVVVHAGTRDGFVVWVGPIMAKPALLINAPNTIQTIRIVNVPADPAELWR
ncbi:hypothetical protein D9M71_669970 [compost metagenome]